MPPGGRQPPPILPRGALSNDVIDEDFLVSSGGVSCLPRLFVSGRNRAHNVTILGSASSSPYPLGVYEQGFRNQRGHLKSGIAFVSHLRPHERIVFVSHLRPHEHGGHRIRLVR